MTGECLYPQLMAKAHAATLDESRIRARSRGRQELRDGLGPLRSLIVEDVHTVDGSGGFGAGEDAELARMLYTWTLTVLGEMDSSLAMSRLPRPAATSRSTSISHSARPNRDGIPWKASSAGPWRAGRRGSGGQRRRSDTQSSPAISGTDRWGRQVARGAGLSLAERRTRATRLRRARLGESAQDADAQGGVRGALPGMALKQSRRAGRMRERKSMRSGSARFRARSMGAERLRRRRACRGRSPPAGLLPPAR